MKFLLPSLLAALFLLDFSSLQAAQLNVTPDNQTAAMPEAKFDPVIDDLPLMPGLTAEPEQGTLFAVKVGRIAESNTTGSVDIDDVYRFYHRTLPQLGWQMIDSRTYRRGGEKLRIDARADGKITTVRFSIKPE